MDRGEASRHMGASSTRLVAHRGCRNPKGLRACRHAPAAGRLYDHSLRSYSRPRKKNLHRIAGRIALFLVGDGHQRIYGQPVKLSSCGIEIRGRSRRLKVNYRTTEQISKVAVSILKGQEIDDLDGSIDSLKGYCSLRSGLSPMNQVFQRESKEMEFIIQTIQEWLKSVPPESICVAGRTLPQLRDRYQVGLSTAGLKTMMVERDPEGEAGIPGIRLATMHRLKGLEFPRVLLVGVHEGSVPPSHLVQEADEEIRKQLELREKCLLYVACTRARDELVITGYGTPSPLMSPFS